MSIELGTISLNEASISKQLRGDMKDDWFPDPLNFSDMMTSEMLSAIMLRNFEENDGQYVSCRRSEFNIPKPNFTLRYALETSLTDRFMYHALTSYLVPFYDQLLPAHVFSHRYNYDKPSERYLFKRGVNAWREFMGSIKSAMAPDKYLLSTDLSNYFEGIDLALLKQGLLKLLPAVKASASTKGIIRIYIEALFESLNRWGYQSERGLPQNRDASSFLANMYMLDVDTKMKLLGYESMYFRYMDDIKIICSDEFSARKALKDLSIALREIGLSLNAKKTEIIAGAEGEKLNKCLEEGSLDIEYLDYIWRTYQPDLILKAIPKLREKTLALISEGRIDSKEFRFCVKRLYDLKLCDTFEIPDEYFYDITPYILQGLIDAPASTDQLAKYLLAAPLSQENLASIATLILDNRKAIYNWQNYRLWILLAQKKYEDAVLINKAISLVQSEQDTPTRAGATLYLGVIADSKVKEEIALNFKSLETFIGQRVALIAIHELPYKALIEPYVKQFIRPDLVGVYTNLRKSKGLYYAPPEKVSFVEAFDTERDYE